MKKTILLLLGLLLTASARSQMVSIFNSSDMGRGDSIDRIGYEVVYDLDATVPSKKDTICYSERMLLQIGSQRSAFFSYVAFQVDSLVEAQLKQGNNVNVNDNSRVSWKLFKNVPSQGHTAYLDKVCMDNYRVVEKTEIPQWELVADSVKTILSYRCRLARAVFKGRLWWAWYAPEVPIDNGPWKLQGLPGLILMASDSHREFVFTAVGLTNVHDSRNIYYKGKNSSEVSRQDLNKIYKRYYNDAIGYARMSFPQSSTNKISIQDENHNELMHSKPQPYNLIEW